MTVDPPRHLLWENFQTLIDAGEPVIEPVAGEPEAHLFIDPGGSRIGLRVRSEDDPPLLPLKEVDVRRIRMGGSAFVEIATRNRRLYRDFHAFVCTVADRAQIEGMPIASAVSDAVDAWNDLMQLSSLLSFEKQLGLMGELWVLERISCSRGWQGAIDAWKKLSNEEHDFGLEECDLEVKSTSLETRRHMIGSLKQLLPLPGRQLFLCSLQFTSAGIGAGFTLSDRIQQMMDAVEGSAPERVGALRDRLEAVGWHDEHARLYTQRFALRSEPFLVPVGADFPALTPALLEALGERQERIDQVSYRVDVTGLGTADGSAEFGAVLPSREAGA